MTIEYEIQLGAATSLAEVADIVRHTARRLVRADGATFVLRDGDLCFYVDEDAIAPLWKGQRFPMTECISGWAMLHREATTVADIESDSRIPYEAYRTTFVKSLAMVPIRRSDPLGAIGAYWAVERTPPADELAALQKLADVTAETIDRMGMATAPWAPNFKIWRSPSTARA